MTIPKSGGRLKENNTEHPQIVITPKAGEEMKCNSSRQTETIVHKADPTKKQHTDSWTSVRSKSAAKLAQPVDSNDSYSITCVE